MRYILASLLAALVFAMPANAQTLDRFDADNVGAILSSYGLAFGVTEDNRGFPAIQIARTQEGGTFAATTTNILFYGCDASGCKDITLHSWFEPPTRVSSLTVNEWNDIFRQSRNWSRAFLDEEGEPMLTQNINAEGSIGAEAVAILIFSYLQEAQDFGQLIGLGATE